jgi:thiol-disulfide isomerase/thioredoxin
MKQSFVVLFLLATLTLGAQEKPVFYFFHSEVCPHCVEAAPFIAFIKEKYPQIEFRELEVYRNLINREILKKKAQELGVAKVGVPFFLIGKTYLSGFKKGEYEEKILLLIEEHLAALKKGAQTAPAPAPAAPAAVTPPPNRVALLQKEAQAIAGAVDGCYEGEPAHINDCLKKMQQRIDELMLVIVAQLAEMLDKSAKSGKQPAGALPSRTAYFDMQALWKKLSDSEAAADEKLCRAKKRLCDGMTTYLTVQNGQTRIQKLLSDLQTIQEISPGI